MPPFGFSQSCPVYKDQRGNEITLVSFLETSLPYRSDAWTQAAFPRQKTGACFSQLGNTVVCYSFSVASLFVRGPCPPESSSAVKCSMKVLRWNLWTVEELLKKPCRANEAAAGNSWQQPAARPGVPPVRVANSWRGPSLTGKRCGP